MGVEKLCLLSSCEHSLVRTLADGREVGDPPRTISLPIMAGGGGGAGVL